MRHTLSKGKLAAIDFEVPELLRVLVDPVTSSSLLCKPLVLLELLRDLGLNSPEASSDYPHEGGNILERIQKEPDLSESAVEPRRARLQFDFAFIAQSSGLILGYWLAAYITVLMEMRRTFCSRCCTLLAES